MNQRRWCDIMMILVYLNNYDKCTDIITSHIDNSSQLHTEPSQQNGNTKKIEVKNKRRMYKIVI